MRAIGIRARRGPDGRARRRPVRGASRPGAGSARSASIRSSSAGSGAGSLPYLFIGLGAIGLTASLAYGAALGRVARIPLLAGLLGWRRRDPARRASADGAPGSDASLSLAWLTVYAVGAIGVTIAWTMAGSVFDARQAKRLFPLCTGAAIAGSFVGTLLVGPVAHAFGTETLIVLEAVLLGVVGGLVVADRRGRRRSGCRPGGATGRSSPTSALGFDTVVRSPLMRLVAIAYVLLAILAFLGHVPVPAGRLGDVHDRGGPGDRPRPPVGGRDRHLVRRLDGARQPGLRPVRRRRRGPAPADRLPRRLRAVARRVLVLDRGDLPVHPAGDPARPLELRPGARSTTSSRASVAPRSWPSTTASRARSGRSCRASSCWRPGRSSRATRSSGSASITAARVHARRGRHPPTLRRERPRQPAGAASASRSSRAARASARLPATRRVSDTLIGALGAPEPGVRRMAAGLLGAARSSARGRRSSGPSTTTPTRRSGPPRSTRSRRWVVRRPRSPRRWRACSTPTNGCAPRPSGRSLRLAVDAATLDTHPWIADWLVTRARPSGRARLPVRLARAGPRSTTIVVDLLAGPGDAASGSPGWHGPAARRARPVEPRHRLVAIRRGRSGCRGAGGAGVAADTDRDRSTSS